MMLRTCMDCGLKAETEEDLEDFVKCATCNHGRMNICKQCSNKRQRHQTLTNNKHNLMARFYAIKRRCYNSKDSSYHNYGGRGINVCQEWLDNPNLFVNWALTNGFKRELEIDRIDNDEGYSPNNCRWVTPKEQNLNKRNNVTNIKIGTRVCWKCGIEKKLSDFHRSKRVCAGRRHICKTCVLTK